MVSISCKAILTACFPLVTSHTGFLIYCCGIGVVAGGIFGLVPKLVVEHYGRDRMPFVYGLATSVSAIGDLVGIPINGHLVDEFGYQACAIFSGVSMLAGVACLVFVAPWTAFYREYYLSFTAQRLSAPVSAKSSGNPHTLTAQQRGAGSRSDMTLPAGSATVHLYTGADPGAEFSDESDSGGDEEKAGAR
jgi:MFS family permease